MMETPSGKLLWRPGELRMRKALVIDDSAPIHALVREHLGRHFQVASAYDGESGLTAARRINPDVILLDVELPDLHGFELCRRLKSDEATKLAPVIFLSAAATSDDKIHGLDCGACDYVTKPFEPWELRARVRAALRSKQALDDLAQDALIDHITGLFNYRYFETRLDGELARARRSGRSLGCILIGLDGMDANCEPAPEPIGRDAMLFCVGQSILQACRREDVVCRFGDDEFAVLAIGVNDAALGVLAERIQLVIPATHLVAGGTTPMTASIGVALSRFSTGLSIVVEAADALEKAKTAGGNRIVFGSELFELRLAS
jgi:diguanylate cyclase (GGDEF)-like protein